MELQSEAVVREPPRPRGKRRRLGRGFMMVVAALGLIAVGALGATLAPRYLGGAPPAPIVPAPIPPVSAPSASEPPAASALPRASRNAVATVRAVPASRALLVSSMSRAAATPDRMAARATLPSASSNVNPRRSVRASQTRPPGGVARADAQLPAVCS